MSSKNEIPKNSSAGVLPEKLKPLSDAEKVELLKEVGKQQEDVVKAQREAIRKILLKFADHVVKNQSSAAALDDEAQNTAIILTNIMNSYATTAVISSLNVMKKHVVEMMDENGRRIIESLKFSSLTRR